MANTHEAVRRKYVGDVLGSLYVGSGIASSRSRRNPIAQHPGPDTHCYPNRERTLQLSPNPVCLISRTFSTIHHQIRTINHAWTTRVLVFSAPRARGLQPGQSAGVLGLEQSTAPQGNHCAGGEIVRGSRRLRALVSLVCVRARKLASNHAPREQDTCHAQLTQVTPPRHRVTRNARMRSRSNTTSRPVVIRTYRLLPSLTPALLGNMSVRRDDQSSAKRLHVIDQLDLCKRQIVGVPRPTTSWRRSWYARAFAACSDNGQDWLC